MQGSTILLHSFYLHHQRKRLSGLPQVPVELLVIEHFRGPMPPCELVKKWYLVPHTWPHTHAHGVSLLSPVFPFPCSYKFLSDVISD